MRLYFWSLIRLISHTHAHNGTCHFHECMRLKSQSGHTRPWPRSDWCFQTNFSIMEPDQSHKLLAEQFSRQVPLWMSNVALERKREREREIGTERCRTIELAGTMVLDAKATRCHRPWISAAVELDRGTCGAPRGWERGDAAERRNSSCAFGRRCVPRNTWYVARGVARSNLRFMCCQTWHRDFSTTSASNRWIIILSSALSSPEVTRDARRGICVRNMTSRGALHVVTRHDV